MSVGSGAASTIVEGTGSEDGGQEITTYEKWRKSLFGRKTKYTPKLKKKILYFTRQGHKQNVTCSLVGLAPSMLYVYLNRYPEFAEEFERAKEFSVARKVKNIEDAGKKDWKAHAWLLGKQRPAEYGDTLSIRASLKGEIKITVTGGGYVVPDNAIDGELVESGKLHGGSK